jgi:hypothetical protein
MQYSDRRMINSSLSSALSWGGYEVAHLLYLLFFFHTMIVIYYLLYDVKTMQLRLYLYPHSSSFVIEMSRALV